MNFLILTGTNSKRRNDEVARLNSEYDAMSKLNVSIDGILCAMIESENYRMLSAQEYTWRESPIRSGRVFEKRAMVIFFINIYFKLLVSLLLHFLID